MRKFTDSSNELGVNEKTEDFQQHGKIEVERENTVLVENDKRLSCS